MTLPWQRDTLSLQDLQSNEATKRLGNLRLKTVLPSTEYVDALLDSTPLASELALTVLDFAAAYASTTLGTSSEDQPTNITQNELVVVKTPPLSAQGAAQLRKVIIRFTSKDQGWSSSPRQLHGTYQGSWTWFTLRVTNGEKQKSLEIQRNRHAGHLMESYTHEFTIEDDILQGLTEGTVFELLAGAHFPGWCNRVAAASIELQSKYNFSKDQASQFMTEWI